MWGLIWYLVNFFSNFKGNKVSLIRTYFEVLSLNKILMFHLASMSERSQETVFPTSSLVVIVPVSLEAGLCLI